MDFLEAKQGGWGRMRKLFIAIAVDCDMLKSVFLNLKKEVV